MAVPMTPLSNKIMRDTLDFFPSFLISSPVNCKSFKAQLWTVHLLHCALWDSTVLHMDLAVGSLSRRYMVLSMVLNLGVLSWIPVKGRRRLHTVQELGWLELVHISQCIVSDLCLVKGGCSLVSRQGVCCKFLWEDISWVSICLSFSQIPRYYEAILIAQKLCLGHLKNRVLVEDVGCLGESALICLLSLGPKLQTGGNPGL